MFYVPMGFLDIPLYALASVLGGAAWIYWRYRCLRSLHADTFRAEADEVLLQD